MPRRNIKAREDIYTPRLTYSKPERKTPKVYVIPNGDSSLSGMAGWYNPSLSDEGYKKMIPVAERLVRERLDAIYTSELARATASADVVTAITKAPIIGYVPDLKPWNIGDLSGKARTLVQPQICQQGQVFPNKPLSKGESWKDFTRRVLPYVLSLLKRTARGEYDRLLLVSHRDTYQIIKVWAIQGMDLSDHTNPHTIYAYSGVLEILSLSLSKEEDIWIPEVLPVDDNQFFGLATDEEI